jgi:flagellar biosynthesis protein FlhF
MEYFTETAETHSKAIDKVKEKYGSGARILMQKKVKVPGFLGLFSRELVEVQGYVQQEKPEPRKSDLEEEKRRIIAQARSDQAAQALAQMAKDIQTIKQKIDTRAEASAPDAADHESLKRVKELLELNDFSQDLREELLSRLRREFTLEDLENFIAVQDAVLEWIAEFIGIQDDQLKNPPPGRPRVIALVGPTGVGKTTTIAKLAAAYSMQRQGARQLKVRIITIDNYRIGARQQMETYAGIMNVPFSSVETNEDLRKILAMHREETDIFLIDTIGKSPKDSVKLAEMKEILDACGKDAEPYLAMSAGTKTSDMREIMRQFEPFAYRSVIVTKLDETLHVGNILSVLKERGKTVAYVTTGQHVPVDIERATVMGFLLNLEGFRVNRIRLEAKYPGGETARIWK